MEWKGAKSHIKLSGPFASCCVYKNYTHASVFTEMQAMAALRHPQSQFKSTLKMTLSVIL